MFYEKELSFLSEIFRKNHINTGTAEIIGSQKTARYGKSRDVLPFSSDILASLAEKTVYRFTDSYELCYLLLLLPDTEPQKVLYVGPYLTAPLSEKQILEIGERNGISSQKQKYLLEYYSSTTLFGSDSPLLSVFTTFCERIWGEGSFPFFDIAQKDVRANPPFSQSMRDAEISDTLVNIKAMERRYAFENEMIRAVSLGRPHLEARFSSAFSTKFFENRLADPIRNAKNYAIIMNTLLRKAAERGGVHPLHLDRVSSDFANKIERLSSLSDNPALMKEIFSTYCRLVREHSLTKYSPIVQKTVLLIDSNLSADLSPSLLAKKQEVSLGYLSTVFKKETKKTLSEYIREKRIEYAAYLLETTSLQVQTVALHCGILDVQYFSKLFKKQTGLTPTQYRASHKNSTGG